MNHVTISVEWNKQNNKKNQNHLSREKNYQAANKSSWLL